VWLFHFNINKFLQEGAPLVLLQSEVWHGTMVTHNLIWELSIDFPFSADPQNSSIIEGTVEPGLDLVESATDALDYGSVALSS